MVPEHSDKNQRAALKTALTDLGEIEFLPDLLIIPGKEVFTRHSKIFEEYANGEKQYYR